MATEHSTEEDIGGYLSVQASQGDKVRVECADGSFTGVVNESPDTPFVEDYETNEVVCFVDDSQDIVGLYAQVTRTTETSIDYDLYGVRMFDGGGDESYGEIQKIVVEDS